MNLRSLGLPPTDCIESEIEISKLVDDATLHAENLAALRRHVNRCRRCQEFLVMALMLADEIRGDDSQAGDRN
jgi:hypothetical protein